MPYYLALSHKAILFKIVLTSRAEDKPRIPTTLESWSVTLCPIMFKISLPMFEDYEDWWDEFIAKCEVILDNSEAGKKHLGEYGKVGNSQIVNAAYLVNVLMPSKLSHMLSKQIREWVFIELKAIGSGEGISQQMVVSELDKAAKARASIDDSID